MRITSVHLKNYKRFTDLHINEIPPTARLVVMIGPNGSGKSSIFDAFLLKSNSSKVNRPLRNETFAGYFLKDKDFEANFSSTLEVANNVEIQLDQSNADWSRVFYIRSPYRHEADFSNANLAPAKPSFETEQFSRIIDQDQVVSEDFSRLGRHALHQALIGERPEKTLDQFRLDTLGELKAELEAMFNEPLLTIQDLGAGLDSGAFRFKKGAAKDFHYKNLSGGEKAAFDLLLDIFVRRDEYQDAIYCIDEPESHIASALHGHLLESMLRLIPSKSQLWLATHSTGFVRRAVELSKQYNNVTFLDFSGHDFDVPVCLTPTVPKQNFFRRMYDVLQDDLAGLVAPDFIVLCEGKKSSEGTDARAYNAIFEESYPDTLFISRGGANEVEQTDLVSVLEAIVPNVGVWRLIDRDDMTEPKRSEKIKAGVQVLGRREIENYLWDKDVVCRALKKMGADDSSIESILSAYPFKYPSKDNMTANNDQQAFFETIRKTKGLLPPGNDRKEFAYVHLAPALRETEAVFRELEKDVFPADFRQPPREC